MMFLNRKEIKALIAIYAFLIITCYWAAGYYQVTIYYFLAMIFSLIEGIMIGAVIYENKL